MTEQGSMTSYCKHFANPDPAALTIIHPYYQEAFTELLGITEL